MPRASQVRGTAAGTGSVRRQVTLVCGHTTWKPPLANRATGVGMYWCDEHGLVRERAR